MSDPICATGAATNVADVLLRAVGGRSVILRLPAPANPSDVTEQLGLAVPSFQDVELGPVVYRRARATVLDGQPARWEMLVSATAVQRLVGSLAYDSAGVLFALAIGVLSDDTLLEVESATAEQVFGRPYVYRLVLRAPLLRIV